MKLRLGENKSRQYTTAFFLSAVTGASFIILMTVWRGTFFIGSDFVHQQVPFWSYANQAVKSGDIWWSDKLDLGTQFIGGFSFYTLGSPFFWLSLLLNGKYFYLFSGAWLVLKFGAAGLFSYIWLRRYTQTNYAALLGSLVYTFSGFQISNMNFNHFADVVALFPLLLAGLDIAVLDHKKGIFAIAVFLSAITSWFSFVGQIVFLLLYFCVKLWCKEYKLTGKLFGRLAFESILGVGMSAIILLPSVLFNLQNPRTSMPFASLWHMLFLKPIHLADLVRGMLLPAESNFYRGFFMQVFFNSGELYLPLFGVVAAAAFVLNRRKSFEARMLGTSLLFALVPLLNSAFVAFNGEYYTRWFTMPILIMCLATVKTVEDTTLPLKKGVLAYGILWALFGAIALWFIYYFKVTFIYNMVIAGIFTLISVGGFLVVANLRRIQKLRWWRPAILLCVMGISFATGFYNIYLMQKTWPKESPAHLFTASSQLSMPREEQYFRMDTDEYFFYNLSMMVDYPSMTSFSSTVNGSIFAFYDLCNLPRSVISSIPSQQYGYRSLLSAKYWVRYSRYGDPSQTDIPGWAPAGFGGTNFHVFENENALPLGFAFANYITEEEFSLVPDENKPLVLNHVLVLDEQTAQDLNGYLTQVSSQDLQAFCQRDYLLAVQARREQSCNSSRKTNQGYEASITLNNPAPVFFSIPWDSGWSATINGEPAQIYKADAGFMAVVCQTGQNEIVFQYKPVGFTVGLGISLFSFTALLTWGGICLFKKQKKANTSKG